MGNLSVVSNSCFYFSYFAPGKHMGILSTEDRGCARTARLILKRTRATGRFTRSIQRVLIW